MLKTMFGIKNTGVLCTYRCNWSQNLVITVPESCHAQPCDHGQSNYPQLNTYLFNPHAVQHRSHNSDHVSWTSIGWDHNALFCMLSKLMVCSVNTQSMVESNCRNNILLWQTSFPGVKLYHVLDVDMQQNCNINQLNIKHPIHIYFPFIMHELGVIQMGKMCMVCCCFVQKTKISP